MTLISLVVFGLTLVIVTLVAVSSKGAVRSAYRAGYWQGKADVHGSLNAFLVENEEELKVHPEFLGAKLTDWFVSEVMHDRALASVQGLTQKERR